MLASIAASSSPDAALQSFQGNVGQPDCSLHPRPDAMVFANLGVSVGVLGRTISVQREICITRLALAGVRYLCLSCNSEEIVRQYEAMLGPLGLQA